MKKLSKEATKLVDEYIDQACDMLQDHCAGLAYGCCIPPDVAEGMAVQFFERVADWCREVARELRSERREQ